MCNPAFKTWLLGGFLVDFEWRHFFSPWLLGGAVLDVEEHVREVERPNRSQDGSWLVN